MLNHEKIFHDCDFDERPALPLQNQWNAFLFFFKKPV